MANTVQMSSFLKYRSGKSKQLSPTLLSQSKMLSFFEFQLPKATLV